MLHCDYRTMSHGDYCVRIQIERERERERANKLQDVTWRLLCPGSDRERKRERELISSGCYIATTGQCHMATTVSGFR